jgi:hypothetical protein
MATSLFISFLVIATPMGDVELLSEPCQDDSYIAVVVAPEPILVCWKKIGDRLVIPKLSINVPFSSTEQIVGKCSAHAIEWLQGSRPPTFLTSAAWPQETPAQLAERVSRACTAEEPGQRMETEWVVPPAAG